MHRGHGEGPLDTEAEGALGVLSDSIAQRSQAAGHRATRLSICPLELLTHGHGGPLQLGVLVLHHRERGVSSLLRRGLIRHRLLQL